MKKREAVILAMMCAAALGNFGNIESAEASAENGTGKVLEIEKRRNRSVSAWRKKMRMCCVRL